jgi:hypothetical protein
LRRSGNQCPVGGRNLLGKILALAHQVGQAIVGGSDARRHPRNRRGGALPHNPLRAFEGFGPQLSGYVIVRTLCCMVGSHDHAKERVCVVAHFGRRILLGAHGDRRSAADPDCARAVECGMRRIPLLEIEIVRGEVVHGDGNIGMARAQGGLAYRQRSLQQRARLVMPLQVVEKAREIVEAVAEERMGRAQGLLADRERAACQRLGLREPAVLVKERCQIVQGNRD